LRRAAARWASPTVRDHHDDYQLVEPFGMLAVIR
jgi:hypothetical protein